MGAGDAAIRDLARSWALPKYKASRAYTTLGEMDRSLIRRVCGCSRGIKYQCSEKER